MAKPAVETGLMAADARERELLKARIRIALSLAIENSADQALRTLDEIESAVESHDDEIKARYFQARAIARIKARDVDEGFIAFEAALGAARRHGEPLMFAKIANNHAAAAMQDGRLDSAIATLDEGLESLRARGDSMPAGLVTFAELLYTSGQLQRAAGVLHQFHATQQADATTSQVVDQEHLLNAASIGIPLGIMLCDEPLLKLSRDPTLIDLAFARKGAWLLGPIVEAFCTLYEHEERRVDHDSLLERAVDALSSLDHSLLFGCRVARLGTATNLPRVAALVARQCAVPSSLMRGHKYLFDSFIAARRRQTERSRELALHAASEFAQSGRPLLQTLASEAAGAIGEAEEILRQCGARVDAARLRWKGEPIRKRLAGELTRRESEVAALISTGSTNREIAESLGISERTVHRHCESIFSKLGIRSRFQLPAATAPPRSGYG
ncbi:MAG: helix-turn-helix transcriptional regulator [Candidatus Cybelea sp.]